MSLEVVHGSLMVSNIVPSIMELISIDCVVGVIESSEYHTLRYGVSSNFAHRNIVGRPGRLEDFTRTEACWVKWSIRSIVFVLFILFIFFILLIFLGFLPLDDWRGLLCACSVDVVPDMRPVKVRRFP